MDIDTDPSCSWTTDTDMALSDTWGWNITYLWVEPQAIQISLSPGMSTASGHQHRLKHQPRPLISRWPLVATWAKDISTNMALVASQAWTLPWPQVVVQAPVSTGSSPQLHLQSHLSTVDETLGLTFSIIFPLHTLLFLSLHHISIHCSGTYLRAWGWHLAVSSSLPRATGSWAGGKPRFLQ